MSETLQKKEMIIMALREELSNSYKNLNYPGEQKQVNFKRKQVIFCEGCPFDGLYLIESGVVKISMKGSNQKNLLVSVAGKGDFPGYQCSLMNIGEYSSTAVALTTVKTTFIPRNFFEHILKNNPEIKKSFLELLGIDIQNISKKMLDLAYKPVRGRLADALLAFDFEGNTSKSEPQISLTRNELANYIGSVRETTTRLLSEFRKEQLIEMNRDFIHVVNHDKLNFISNLYK